VKQCSKCGEWKDESEFRKRHNQCKTCIALYTKRYYKNNIEKMKEIYYNWRVNNSEKLRNNRKQYRINNPKKVKQAHDKWNKNNSEKIKQSERYYYINNSEKRKEYVNKWNKNNPEKRKEWQMNNPEKVIMKSTKSRFKCKWGCELPQEFLEAYVALALARKAIRNVRKEKV
jgi:hypothetical protein